LKNHPEVLSEPLTGNISFHTLSGELIVDISSKRGSILMDFPADPPSQVHSKTTAVQVAEALGLSSDDLVNVEVSKLCGYAVIEITQSVDIASLPVDSGKLVCQSKI
jgi:predicted PhzF superfamily epimerase YddE/YHI9